jgi:hypothetical protein
MRLIKYYKRPDRPEIVRLDKIATEDFGCVRRGDILVTYPLHLQDHMRLCMWLNPKTVHVDWIREVSDANDDVA